MKKEKVIVTILSSVILVGIVGVIFANADDDVPSEDIVPEESVLISETVDVSAVPSDEEVIFSESEEVVPSDTEITSDETVADVEEPILSETEVLVSTDETVLDATEASETEISEEVVTDNLEESVTEETVVETTEVINLYPYEDCMYLENIATCYLVVDYDIKLSPDPNAEILCTLPAGTEINQTGIALDSPWIKVDIDGTEAYINIMAVSFDANNLSSQDYMSDAEVEELWLGINGWSN